jgi:hypothetical protein
MGVGDMPGHAGRVVLPHALSSETQSGQQTAVQDHKDTNCQIGYLKIPCMEVNISHFWNHFHVLDWVIMMLIYSRFTSQLQLDNQ